MKKIFINFALFLVIFILPEIKSLGQDKNSAFIQTDTVRLRKRFSIIALPMVFYTPETQFGFGGGMQVLSHLNQNIYNSRLSNIFLDLIYTTEKQLIFDAKPQVYFNRGDYYLDAAFKYKLYPNSFWGIGNDTEESDQERYNMKSVTLDVSFLKRLPPALNFGLKFKFEDHHMIEVQEGGQLAESSIPGSEGARIAGIGFALNYDSRDNLFTTNKGQLVEIYGSISSKAFSATHSFSKYVLDLRNYWPMGKKFTLATQVYIENNIGDVPFQGMAWLGGGEKMRGYFKGRYMDKQYYIFQAEERMRLGKRFKLAGFASIGKVSSDPRFTFQDFRFSYGGGIRFQLVKSNPTIIRLDIGVSDKGKTGVYFNVNEAF